MFKIPATFCCILLILYFFRIDRKENNGISNVTWLPFAWLLFSDSREFSFWLYYCFNIGFFSESVIEGNLVDRTLQILLLVLGINLLRKRRIKWGQLLKSNRAIFLYFCFGVISILWSDYPFVSLKRLVKTLGTITMALVVLSDDQPYTALGTTLRRLSFVFLPLSVIFIKYYPDLGRQFHGWSGTQWFTGVAGSKNGLGAICLVAGIYFSWILIFSRVGDDNFQERLHTSIYMIILPMLLWLFYIVDSATSIFCMLVAFGIFIVARQGSVVRKPRKLIFVFLSSIAVISVLEFVFDLKNSVIGLLGRRPDLTTRMPMWEDLLSMVTDPLIGFGYESFWLGDRLKYVQEIYGPLIQAHNGYIETYLNVGGIGLFLLMIWIVVGFKKISDALFTNYATAVFKFCILVVVCMYNWTEATFYGMGSLWFLFLFSTIDMTGQREVLSKDRMPERQFGNKMGGNIFEAHKKEYKQI